MEMRKKIPDMPCLNYNGTNEKPDIKIFVSHRIDQDSVVIDNPLYIPVRCGATFDQRENIEMIGDDTGENISPKREIYGELTVQYWAWKNVNADYYGLCHYRRYLSFSSKRLPEDIWGNINYNYLDDEAIEELNLSEEIMRETISKYDFIISEPFRGSSVYEQYKNVPELYIEDLDKCVEIIREYFPEYIDATEKYLREKNFYPCCLFVMTKKLFFEYSEWLFSILDIFEKEKDTSNYGNAAIRTPGHLGERLLGIYFTYILMKKPQYKTKILQRAIFWNSNEVVYPKPKFSKNNIPIVMTSSDYFVPYAAAALLSIVRESSVENNYDIIFLYSFISDRSKTILEQTVKGRSNFAIRFFCVSPILKKYKFISNNHVSVETFYRLFVQKIFFQYNKIIYIDSDVIVKSDLAKLYFTNIGNNLLGATVDPDWISQYNGAIPKVKINCKKKLKLKNPYLYFQAGVLVFNIEEMVKTFNEEELARFASSSEFIYVDQDVLNSCCQGRVFFFDMSWNVMTSCGGQRTKNISIYAPKYIVEQYEKARKSPQVIHYAGYIKPWNDPTEDFACEFWNCVRGTFLYEIMLSRLGSDVSWHTTADYINYMSQQTKQNQRSLRGIKIRFFEWVKRISFIFLPNGSRRRERIKYLYYRLIQK